MARESRHKSQRRSASRRSPFERSEDSEYGEFQKPERDLVHGFTSYHGGRGARQSPRPVGRGRGAGPAWIASEGRFGTSMSSGAGASTSTYRGRFPALPSPFETSVPRTVTTQGREWFPPKAPPPASKMAELAPLFDMEWFQPNATAPAVPEDRLRKCDWDLIPLTDQQRGTFLSFYLELMTWRQLNLDLNQAPIHDLPYRFCQMMYESRTDGKGAYLEKVKALSPLSTTCLCILRRGVDETR